MTEISLSAINAKSPYNLRKSELGGFDFDVDAGITYNVITFSVPMILKLYQELTSSSR